MGFVAIFKHFSGFEFFPAPKQSPRPPTCKYPLRGRCRKPLGVWSFTSRKKRIINEVVVPEIETERLLLRQITPNDIDEFARRIFADPDVIRYMPKRDMTPRERAERAYNLSNQNWSVHGYGAWLITDKGDGQLIGSCDFDTEEMSDVELGYTLAKAYWGKGIATEVARAAVRFGFETIKLERIVAVVVPANTASWRVLERVGFIHEKKAHYYGFDVVYYVIKRDQFQPGNSFYRILTPKSP